MAYFGETVPEYPVAAFQMLGDGGNNYNFAQVDSALVLTAPAGASITAIEFGADSAASQAGGTIDVGIMNITGGVDGATIIATTTINLRSDNVGYVWHAKSGLSIPLTEGNIYAICLAKPTLNVFVAANAADPIVFGSKSTPATTSLPGTWVADEAGARNIPLRANYEASSSAIDSITTGGNPGLIVGQPFAITTTGLTDLVEVVARTTGVLNAITTAIDLVAPGGDGTAELKFWVDGEYYPYIGTVRVEATDLINNPVLDVDLSLPAGHVSVTFSSVVTSDNTYIGYWLDALGHPLANGDFGYYINSNGLVVDPNSAVHCLSAMSFTLWVHKDSAMIEGYSITINDSGEITAASRITSRSFTSRKITSRNITTRTIT